jgi:hypothetical protein
MRAEAAVSSGPARGTSALVNRHGVSRGTDAPVPAREAERICHARPRGGTEVPRPWRGGGGTDTPRLADRD